MTSYTRALALIDQAHQADPNQITTNNTTLPYEQHYAEKMTSYLDRLQPNASELLRLAIRDTTNGTLKSRTLAFEPLITDLIMLGGDADTNACFAGALVGAYLGYANLPLNWRNGLRHCSWLMGKAEGLCQMLGVADGEYVGSADKETARDGGRGEMPSEADMEGKVMVLQAWMAEQEQEAKKTASKLEDNKWFKWKIWP